MSKRQTEPEPSHPAPKKAKGNSVFRSAVPRVTRTADEASSSRSTLRSTVITLSKTEDGRRRASGRYRNQQQRSSSLKVPIPGPNIEACGGDSAPTDEISATVTPDTTQTSRTGKRTRNNNTAVSGYTFFSYLATFLSFFYRVVSRNGSHNAKCFSMNSFDMTVAATFSTTRPAWFARNRINFISARTARMVPC
jgi:hypothetical protein